MDFTELAQDCLWEGCILC